MIAPFINQPKGAVTPVRAARSAERKRDARNGFGQKRPVR